MSPDMLSLKRIFLTPDTIPFSDTASVIHGAHHRHCLSQSEVSSSAMLIVESVGHRAPAMLWLRRAKARDVLKPRCSAPWIHGLAVLAVAHDVCLRPRSRMKSGFTSLVK